MAVNYEFVFLTPTEIDKEKVEKTFSQLEKQLKTIDGKITKKEDWGKKNLAYKIKGNDQADFWVWDLELPEETKFSSLNTFLNRNEIIIRYLLLKKD